MTDKNLELHNSIILDSIADGVFTVDNDWNVTSFNGAAEKIIGISRRDAMGRKCWEVFHADVCEKSCTLRKTLKTGTPCTNKTVTIVNSQGKAVPISISTAILRDRNGVVAGGVETFRDLSELQELRKEIVGRNTFSDIVTRDHRLLSMFDSLPAIARSNSPVLILGESGTGKELMARAVHNLSARATGPFVAVNCGALPENLLESELFGYRKGAFTDAKTDKPGRFDRAQGGTLFLDEIADLTQSIQVKLLRVLQEHIYEPLGSTTSVKADVRIISATNRDIESMVHQGTFRQDLYYRINIMPLTLPPLRERSGDIPLLTDHFINHFNSLYHKNIERLSSDALSALMSYSYPGNIRELENMMHHAFVLCEEAVIERRHFPDRFNQKNAPGLKAADSLELFEKKQIEEALAQNRYNRTLTSRRLGIHPTTLWRKMRKLGIDG
ncbi:MAG: sigma-54 interaction domain-containing protein [Chitinivibrionales bacterium]